MEALDAAPAPRPASLVRVLLAGLAGLSLASVVPAYLYPKAVGLLLWDLKYLAVWIGAVPLAVLGALAAYALARRAAVSAVSAERAAFWIGAALALGGCAGAWFGYPSDWQGIGKWGLPLFGLAFVVLALTLGRRLPAPGVRVNALLAAAAVLFAAVCLSGAGGRVIDPTKDFVVAERTPLRGGGGRAGARPDLVLISIDTLRADALLHEQVDTPNLDALRAGGLWSEYALAPAPSTLPSHVTMLTGMNVLSHGTILNTHKIPGDVPRLAVELKNAGYLTFGLAANAIIDNRTTLGEGFDLYENYAPHDPYFKVAREVPWKGPRCTWLGWLLPSPHDQRALIALVAARVAESEAGSAPGGLMRDFALAYLEDAARQPAPYFMFLHFMDPHQPYSPDPSVAGRLTSHLQLPERYRGRSVGDPLVARAMQKDLEVGVAEARDALRVLQAAYHEELLFLDQAIGQVLEQIRRSGRPTVVLVTGDHGEHFGEHNLMLHNNSAYEPLLRVPFILAGPSVPPGKLANAPHLEDVAPTLLALAGVPVPPTMEGRNVLALDAATRTRIAVAPKDIAFYDGSWKLICDYEGLGSQLQRLEPKALYDLATDPQEANNLLAREPERAAKMLEATRILVGAARSGEKRELTDEEKARIAALGYGELLEDEETAH